MAQDKTNQAALALAEAVRKDTLMPFSYWEVDGVFVAVFQDDAAESFRQLIRPVSNFESTQSGNA